MISRPLLPAAVALACAGLPAGAHAEIGSAGLGDPLFPDAGNGGYDVSSYDLDLDYSPKENRLNGEAEITATATISLDRFNLDLRKPPKVSSVRVNGAPADFQHSGQELAITPPAPLAQGGEFTVAVSYRGKPQPVQDADGTTEGWIATGDGAFAPNEPRGSPSWYPCNDHPSDKALFTIALTVPKKVEAVSNGKLIEKSSAGGRRTWLWKESQPMATYLATAAIGRFKITRSKEGPAPSLFAVDPAVRRETRNPEKKSRPLQRTPNITRYLAGQFGPYPFGSNGGIVDLVPAFPYALETQTRPIYTRLPSTGLVVHEIAHQWYGNSVTPASWQDIWLNEGFATFAEWLYSEDHGGDTTAQIFKKLYRVPEADETVWKPPPGDPGAAKHLFATSVYQRGAMTLQALRAKVGDEVFFSILRAWAAEHAYGNVTTADFVALAERESGLELDEFFRVWLFEPAKPEDW